MFATPPAAEETLARGSKNGAAKPKAARASKSKGGNGRDINPGDNSQAIAAGFHSHRSKWAEIQNRLKAVQNQLKDMVALAKADGYLKQEFVIADMLAKSPKAEAKVVAAVETRIRVARWLGHGLGNQYDLFADSKPLDPEDAAYQDGRRTANEGGNAIAPSQFSTGSLEQRWLSGYHEAQSQMVKDGIKPLDQKPAGWGTGA